MDTAKNLGNIIIRQKEILADLEVEHQTLEHSDLVKENLQLKAELEKINLECEWVNSKASILTRENSSLKNALYEQLYNEKIGIINATTKKFDIYFKDNINSELSRLAELEKTVKERIDQAKASLINNNIDLKDDIYLKLEEVLLLLDKKVTEVRASAAQIASPFSQEEQLELESLKKEQITDEQIRAVTQKNSLERLIGLNVINAIGIFLLIVGSVTLARFTYTQLSDVLKGIMLFICGGAMLTAGEILNRKKPNAFSLGVSAGGIAILYVALATSYFGLQILNMYPAILLCVFITTVAFVLSTRYNSQLIATFALIGGYLAIYPIISPTIMDIFLPQVGSGYEFGHEPGVIYGVMVYLVILNLLALLISFVKKWNVLSFTGLFLNIIATFSVCAYFYGTKDIIKIIITITYAFFAFIIYTSIPIINTYRAKLHFRKPDIVFLGINTIFSSIIIYTIFYNFNLKDYNGLLAVIFAVIYLLLGMLIEKKFVGNELHTRSLFYLTGMAFVILIIPFQFGKSWLSLGWLIEGVLLATYGILNNEKMFKQIGFFISVLCLSAFLIQDCTQSENYLFIYKYFAITLGSITILGAYMYKKLMSGQFVSAYKYFVLFNLWLFTMYLVRIKIWDVLYTAYGWDTIYQINYSLSAAAIVITFCLAYIFPRIKLLFDSGIKILSIILNVIGLLALFVVNTSMTPVAPEYLKAGTPAFGITVIGTVILIMLGALSVFIMRDLVKTLVLEHKLGIEWYPLIVSAYFLIILTQNLIVQFDLSFSSAAISIIYVLTALTWIILGFARRYPFIRMFGLGLAALSVIKLFLIDLGSLTQGYRIVSFFALGLILVAISFVYQYFSKRLELKVKVISDAETVS